MRRRGKHDVRVERGVGEHLIVHDREQVVAGQALEHELLAGRGHCRVRPLDEQHADRRKLGAELVHVDLAATLRRVPQREVAGSAEARHDPRAEHAELPGEHGQREHRPERRATVAVPLESPSDADERGADRRELLGERGDVGGRHAGDIGGAFEPPRGGRRYHLIRASSRAPRRTPGR